MNRVVVPEIELTADGTATLYRADMDEHYHSVKGALAESRHVYVDSGLRYRMAKNSESGTVTVLEVGFGTGLNAALSAECATVFSSPVHYVALELYPLDAALVESMALPVVYMPDVTRAPWNELCRINEYFTLEKRKSDYLTCDLPEGIDVVYFDAFAPEKQPEMWNPQRFGQLFEAMNGGGVLTTYCAKGAVRRMLESVGFIVERLAGPVGGKREILRCTKPL